MGWEIQQFNKISYLVVVGALEVLSDSLDEERFEEDREQSDWNHERLEQQNNGTECLQHNTRTYWTIVNHDNVYGAIIMTKVIARVHPVHLMNADIQRVREDLQRADDLGCESAENWQLPSTSTIAIVIITQPVSRYSFYRPTEGGRLSRPRDDPVYPLHIPTNNLPTVSLD